MNRSDIGKVFVGGRGIMRRVNEFFRQDVKLGSNRSRRNTPPPAIYHVSREIMVGRGFVGGGNHVSYRVFQEIFIF